MKIFAVERIEDNSNPGFYYCELANTDAGFVFSEPFKFYAELISPSRKH